VTATTPAGSPTFTIRTAKDLSGVPNQITLGNGAGTAFSNGATLELFTMSSGTSGGDLASVVPTGAYRSLTFTRQFESWLAQSGSQQLTCSETTGLLQVLEVVPEPATIVLLAGIGLCAAT